MSSKPRHMLLFISRTGNEEIWECERTDCELRLVKDTSAPADAMPFYLRADNVHIAHSYDYNSQHVMRLDRTEPYCEPGGAPNDKYIWRCRECGYEVELKYLPPATYRPFRVPDGIDHAVPEAAQPKSLGIRTATGARPAMDNILPGEGLNEADLAFLAQLGDAPK